MICFRIVTTPAKSNHLHRILGPSEISYVHFLRLNGILGTGSDAYVVGLLRHFSFY